MPMMRRGPLGRYNAEWVLRQASASATSGSIEFHTDQPLTLYLRNGRICDALEGVAETGLAEDADVPADEASARQRVVELVTVAMGATEGWYYLDPIGHHAVAPSWDWDAASLILDARIRRRATENRAASPPSTEATGVPSGTPTPPNPAAAPAPASDAAGRPGAHAPVPNRRIELVLPDDEQRITFTAEAWRIVCALAAPRQSSHLREDLGWTGTRFDAALSELDAAGVLTAPLASEPPSGPRATSVSDPAPAPEPVPVAPVTTPVAGPAVLAPVTVAPRSVPPNVPPLPGTRPKPNADRRSALRRLISNLKPA